MRITKMIETLLLTFFSLSLIGQSATEIRLNPTDDGETHKCYNLELNFSGEQAVLASQNYRLFYDASSISLMDTIVDMFLPEEQYTFSIIQHNDGVDASGIGKLEFEKTLGFVNATVILNDPRYGGYDLLDNQLWQPIVKFCFQIVDDMIPAKIILARDELTATYGRAFVELSVADSNGSIQPLPISKYYDIEK